MASELAKTLRDRRLHAWEEAKVVIQAAADEKRSLNSEEQGKYEACMVEIDDLDVRIKEILDREERSKDADRAFDRLAGMPRDERAVASQVNDQLRALVRREHGPRVETEIMPSPRAKGLGTAARLNELRTLSTTAASVGLNLVPTDFYDQLISHLIEVSGVMQAGPTVVHTDGGEPLQIPKTTSHSSAASAAQAGTIPSSDPAFGLVTLNSYKYGILLQVARELIDDGGVDLLSYLAMQAGRAIGNKFGSDLVTGAGSTQPTGFLGSASVGVTGATTGKGGAPQYADLVNLEYSVIAPYRQSRSCYWIAKDATIGGFRLIVDGNARPIWEPSAVLGSPDLLLGKPLVADPFIPAVATGSTVFSVAFGDFSQFFVRLVGGVRFERSDDFLFNQDLVAFRCLLRGDGAMVDTTGAIKKYQAPTA